MHKRRQILEALQAQLKTLSGFSGVWIQRIPPLRIAYPSITLFSSTENNVTEGFGIVAREQERELIVSVSAWVKGSQDDEKCELSMDNAAELIENKLIKPSDATDLLLISTEWNVVEDEPEIHVVTLSYQVNYCTLENSSSV